MLNFLKIFILTIFASSLRAEPLQIAVSDNLSLLQRNFQHLIEIAISNAGFQVEFIESASPDTLSKSDAGELDGELYRYSHTMQAYQNLLMIPVKLNSSALFVYVAQPYNCPDFQSLSQHTPVGIAGITYFNLLYESSQVGFLEQDTLASAFELLLKYPLSYTAIPDDIAPSLMELTGVKLKRCYQQPIYVLSAYSYLHNKHADKIDAIARELDALLRSENH